MKIPFNRPTILGSEIKAVNKVIKAQKFSGDGFYNLLCQKILEKKLHSHVLIVPSGTNALEMAAKLIGFMPGDEVIMPSYTFSSTANAFILAGAKIVFVDIRPDTLNIDEKLIEQAITKKTKAIVMVHYGGVACEMDEIMRTAKKHKLFVVEDAAQAIGAKYHGQFLGTFGDFGTLSFHETKNVQCGEGGALIINKGKYLERAEVMREKGTDRSRFHRGQVDKYSWKEVGSSYLLGELSAAFLSEQLKKTGNINRERLKSWNLYYKLLKPLAEAGWLDLPTVPGGCQHNGHIFYIKLKSHKERESLRRYLNKKGIQAVFHYLPLHKSQAGKKYGVFSSSDVFTSKESQRLLRLPLFFDLKPKEVQSVVNSIYNYFQ